MSLQPDLGADFPALPKIHSDAIRQQVFTHRSFYARPTHIFEDGPHDLSPDNEKFEHLGDTVLGLVVTDLMFDMYPGLRVGPATKIRALIVANFTLAEISVRYRLPERLRLHPAQALSLRASSNVQADVFESFVGGLYKDQGLESVKDWLSALLSPYITAAYQLVRAQHGLPPSPPAVQPSLSDSPPPSDEFAGSSMASSGHLALFNQHLQKLNRAVEWVYGNDEIVVDATESEFLRGIKTTPVWSVQVIVDGQSLGKGRGNTKKSARNEAAKVGLQNLGVHV
ncbi:ribonuclease III domain-containing protein [Mycena floridula]|nr:ribonuclease III domain-containing protein [Mycena floridula]